MIEYIDTGLEPTQPVVQPPYFPPICGCKCWDGNTLVRDFEPCKNEEGEYGMYDHVSGEFWPADVFLQKAIEFFKAADNVSVSHGGGIE